MTMSAIRQKQQSYQNEAHWRMIKYRVEPVMCKTFGCGKELTLEEQMAGDHCHQHCDQKEIDIMNVLKFK